MKELRATTAEEFLSILSLTGERFGESEPDQLIFRGHGDAAWKLIPSALRAPLAFNGEQVAHEANALYLFLEYADRQGLPVPNDSHELRSELIHAADNPNTFLSDIVLEDGPSVWPRRSMFGLMALAQHNGMSTRMLDWSRNPLAAAYFAVSEEPRLASDFVAVWACDLHALDTGGFTMYHDSLEIVNIPYAGNNNALAQAGLFLLAARRMVDAEAPVETDTMQNMLEVVKGGSAPLTKIALPRNQTRRVLRLLARHGISAATMFPGYRGAALAVAERQRWE